MRQTPARRGSARGRDDARVLQTPRSADRVLVPSRIDPSIVREGCRTATVKPLLLDFIAADPTPFLRNRVDTMNKCPDA